MATSQNHISFSVILALVYAVGAMLVFFVPVEHALLAGVIIVVAGMLPNIDQNGSAQEKELAGVVAAVSPLLVLQYFPSVSAGGVARTVLVLVCCYALTRLLVVRIMQKYTTHRGMIHSIPAAIITSQLTYLLFWDLSWKRKTFFAAAAFLGFISHLLVDAYGNFDLVGKATGKENKKPAVLKVFAKTGGANFALFACICFLSWLIARDFYPGLGFYAGVKY